MNLFKKEENQDIDIKIANQIRALGLDIIKTAGKGHEGVVLSFAPVIYTLFSKHLNINPKDSKYLNRDRLVVSMGHASALLYATMYMGGFPYTEEDLKNYRKIGSNVPGHPEYNLDTGIEMTTGPLGEGFAASVGMAISEEYLRNYFKSKNIDLIDHYTYVLVSDGDLMEGVSYEAASLAGTLKLNKLIVLYDNNNTTIDGSCDLTFTENILERFKAMGWNIIEVNNSEDISAIDKAIASAKESDMPSFISVKTTIGKYSKYENSNLIHGHILTDEDISEIKNKLELRDVSFAVSNELMEEFQNQINGRILEKYEEFNKKLESIDDKYITKLINNDLTVNLGEIIDVTDVDSIRNYSHKVLNSINDDLFMSSSSDLFKSCKNYLDDKGDFSSKNRLGKNVFGGVREHLMAAVSSGLTLSGIRNVTSTFLVFSDYMLPSIRLAAIMNIPNIYIFTHDSINIGSDGITHQPIEQLDNLRNIPNVEVFRPSDMNEVIGTFKTVLSKNKGVSIIVLSKDEISTKIGTSINDTSLGGYIVKEEEGIPFFNLIASGEDLDTALQLEQRLLTKGIFTRVISMPSINRFDIQDVEYKNKVIAKEEKVFAIESSTAYNYLKYVSSPSHLFNIEKFGYSGDKEDIKNKLNFDIDALEEKIEHLL